MAEDNSATEKTNQPVGNPDELPPDPAAHDTAESQSTGSVETSKTDPNRANAKPAVNQAKRKLNQ